MIVFAVVRRRVSYVNHVSHGTVHQTAVASMLEEASGMNRVHAFSGVGVLYSEHTIHVAL